MDDKERVESADTTSMTATLSTAQSLPKRAPRSFGDRVLDRVLGEHVSQEVFVEAIDRAIASEDGTPSFYSAEIAIQFGYRTSRVGWISQNCVRVR